jgi:hypothetical protein
MTKGKFNVNFRIRGDNFDKFHAVSFHYKTNVGTAVFQKLLDEKFDELTKKQPPISREVLAVENQTYLAQMNSILIQFIQNHRLQSLDDDKLSTTINDFVYGKKKLIGPVEWVVVGRHIAYMGSSRVGNKEHIKTLVNNKELFIHNEPTGGRDKIYWCFVVNSYLAKVCGNYKQCHHCPYLPPEEIVVDTPSKKDPINMTKSDNHSKKGIIDMTKSDNVAEKEEDS